MRQFDLPPQATEDPAPANRGDDPE
jgi:hypothetical protein